MSKTDHVTFCTVPILESACLGAFEEVGLEVHQIVDFIESTVQTHFRPHNIVPVLLLVVLFIVSRYHNKEYIDREPGDETTPVADTLSLSGTYLPVHLTVTSGQCSIIECCSSLHVQG